MRVIRLLALLLPAHGYVIPAPQRRSATRLRTRASIRLGAATTATVVDECDVEDETCVSRYDPVALDARFADSPLEVVGRVAQVLGAVVKVRLAGDDGGATLRSELASLGPVFCKVGQTMATRPDIVGAAVSAQVCDTGVWNREERC